MCVGAAGSSWVLVCIWAGPPRVWRSWEDRCSAAPAGGLPPPLQGKTRPSPLWCHVDDDFLLFHITNLVFLLQAVFIQLHQNQSRSADLPSRSGLQQQQLQSLRLITSCLMEAVGGAWRHQSFSSRWIIRLLFSKCKIKCSFFYLKEFYFEGPSSFDLCLNLLYY